MPRHSTLNIHYYLNILKTKFVEHSMKEPTLKPINGHFVSHCQSHPEESFSFGTSRAHGALDKGSNIENFYSAKKQGECLNKQKY
jgi:hypothetical protein